MRKVQKQYFSNLDPKRITENKKLWESVKPLFSVKITVKEMINQIENGEMRTSDIDIAETIDDFCSNVVQNFNIPGKKLPVEHGSLHKSSDGSKREIKISQKHYFFE